MKKIFLLPVFLILALNQLILTQTHSRYKEILKSKFENFEYEKIISLTDSLLIHSQNLTREDSIQIFFYRAISGFHLWDIKFSEREFKILLKLDNNFSLDSNEVSPKIISFFNQIKKEEQENFSNQSSNLKQQNDLIISQRNEYINYFSKYQEAVWKNLIFPGWGCFTMNNKTKGYIYSSVFSISLVSSVYFYLRTNSKEKDYLSETNPDKISEKYSVYNISYKLRNISLLSLGLIYIYSQLDIITNNPFKSLEKNISVNPEFSSLNFSLLKFKITLK